MKPPTGLRTYLTASLWGNMDSNTITAAEPPFTYLVRQPAKTRQILFYDASLKVCGKLSMRDGRIDFEGDATESAKRFFEAFGKMFTGGSKEHGVWHPWDETEATKHEKLLIYGYDDGLDEGKDEPIVMLAKWAAYFKGWVHGDWQVTKPLKFMIVPTPNQ